MAVFGIVGRPAPRYEPRPEAAAPTDRFVIAAGRDVVLGDRTTNEPAREPHDAAPSLVTEERDSELVPNWDNDWRVTIRVTNVAESAEVSAYVIAPVEGVNASDYGDLNLNWETVPNIFTTLVLNKPERLHVARISGTHRTVRFLGPGASFGELRDHHHEGNQREGSAVQDTRVV